jgi:hypothetical protein
MAVVALPVDHVRAATEAHHQVEETRVHQQRQ